MNESYQAHQQQYLSFEYSNPVLQRLDFAGELNALVERVNVLVEKVNVAGEKLLKIASLEKAVSKLQQTIRESWKTSSPCSRLSVRDHPESSASAKMLRLHFDCRIPPDGLYTFIELTKQHAEFKVEVRDSSGSIVEVGSPQSPVKIKIFALEDKDDHSDIAKPRDDKAPLLKGNCEFYMSNGVAVICGIAFTDNSSCRFNKRFRFGARVVNGLPSGVEIKDAKSEAFRVKERRTMKNRRQNSTSKQADSARGYSHAVTCTEHAVTCTEHAIMNALALDNMQAGQLGSSLTLNHREQGAELLSRQFQAQLNNTMSSSSQYWSTTGIPDVTGFEAAMATSPHGSSVSPTGSAQVLRGMANETTPQDQVMSYLIIQDRQLEQHPQLGFRPGDQVQDYGQPFNTCGEAAKRRRSC